MWRLLGDMPHYVEPFAGSLAVLLQRPHLGNDGQGVNHPGTREPGVKGQRPDLADAHQQHRERLWASPHCLTPASTQQGALW